MPSELSGGGMVRVLESLAVLYGAFMTWCLPEL
jgi:hypothetical protein